MIFASSIIWQISAFCTTSCQRWFQVTESCRPSGRLTSQVQKTIGRILMNKTPLACLCALALMAPSSALFASENSDESEQLREQIEQMQRQLMEMQSRLEDMQSARDADQMARERVEARVEEVAETAEQAALEEESGINVGGAVRFQYVFED